MTIRPSRTLSVVVPILNERNNLAALLKHLSTLEAEQLILVDGGSKDDSVAWLQSNWVDHDAHRLLVQSSAGRAKQMNAGARIAGADMLVFLHADTFLPGNAKLEITRARDSNYFWGRFDVEFNPGSGNNWAMNIIALFMNIRSRLSSIATGDQAIFVDRALFVEIGGYPSIPLMEDIALSKRLKRNGVPYCSYSKVRTSPRRWQSQGVVRTVITMWIIRFGYFVGVSPNRLVSWYQNIR